MPNADKAPGMDKQIDLFDPLLIDSQKTYARDLLTHVNAYTHIAYAAEPAVAMVEINNENTLFIWGAEQDLQNLPEPFAGELQRVWNEWLVKKYGTRAALAAAWGKLSPSGKEGLTEAEGLEKSTVRVKLKSVAMTPARARDWYDFLQSLDEKYFTGMYDYLKRDLHVAAPVTGTIGMGSLGTLSQTHTDFIDAHEYWQHPIFPNGGWSTTDYHIGNSPMVDSNTRGTLPSLAAIRVVGMPFTVTEYDHPAPSDWRAEALPLLATTAALQDWDAIFIFAYSHSAKFHRDHSDSFFDLAADPAQLNLMPVAARLFLSGAIAPLAPSPPIQISHEEALNSGGRDYFNLAAQLKDLHGIGPDTFLKQQESITFAPTQALAGESEVSQPPSWTTSGAGTGQFTFKSPHAAEFIGFPKQGQIVDLGPLALRDIASPFVVATLIPNNPGQDLASANEMLLTITGRTENHDMVWNAEHTSVGDHWGTGPVRLETIAATVQLPPGYALTASTPPRRAATHPVEMSILRRWKQAGFASPAVAGESSVSGLGALQRNALSKEGPAMQSPKGTMNHVFAAAFMVGMSALAFAQSAPATRPALDLSSPRSTLLAIYASMRAGDIHSVKSCLIFEDPAAADVFEANAAQVCAPLRLMHAMEKRFGDAARKPFDLSVEKSIDEAIARVKRADIQETGDTAVVAERKAAVNPDAETELGGVTLKKANGEWKVVASTFPESGGDVSPKELALMHSLRDALVTAVETTVARIERGDFRSADDAYGAYQALLQPVQVPRAS